MQNFREIRMLFWAEFHSKFWVEFLKNFGAVCFTDEIPSKKSWKIPKKKSCNMIESAQLALFLIQFVNLSSQNFLKNSKAIWSLRSENYKYDEMLI